jgi:glutamyl-tRNA reductase
MLISVGLDHRHAHLETRERFHLDDDAVAAIRKVLTGRGAQETVLVRTCNRVEIYSFWPERDNAAAPLNAADEVCRAWAGHGDHDPDLLRSSARIRIGDDAVRHLFRVASGLESQILGDIHILGQVRRALRDAVSGQSVGPHLQRLFETALRVGKQVQRETMFRATRSSVGSEAARWADVRSGGVAGRHCVVIGCGKSGTQAARTLRDLGAEKISVVNRTRARAERLAAEIGRTEVADLESLTDVLSSAHVVIVATSSHRPVLTIEDVLAARTRSGHIIPLLVVDVSVPRNVETGVGQLSHVELLDLDALRPESSDLETEAVRDAQRLVEDAVEEFQRWLALRPAGRVLRPFHEVLTEICRRELSYVGGDLGSAAERTASRIVARIMAHPMTTLREASARGESLFDELSALALLFSGPRSTASPEGLAVQEEFGTHVGS